MKKNKVTQILVIVAVTAFGITTARAQVQINSPPRNVVPGSNIDQSAGEAAIKDQQNRI